MSSDLFLFCVTCFCFAWLVSVSSDLFLFRVTCFCFAWLVFMSRDLFLFRVTCFCFAWLVFVSRDLFLCHVTCFYFAWLVFVSRDLFLFRVTCLFFKWLVCFSRDLFLFHVTRFCFTILVCVSRDLLPPRNTWELLSSGLHPSPLIPCTSQYNKTPLFRTLVIRIAYYPNRLGPSGRFVQNSTKLIHLEITGYRIKLQYSVVAYRTENQASSKGLDAGTYCK
jgi:hypothetical protein